MGPETDEAAFAPNEEIAAYFDDLTTFVNQVTKHHLALYKDLDTWGQRLSDRSNRLSTQYPHDARISLMSALLHTLYGGVVAGDDAIERTVARLNGALTNLLKTLNENAPDETDVTVDEATGVPSSTMDEIEALLAAANLKSAESENEDDEDDEDDEDFEPDDDDGG